MSKLQNSEILVEVKTIHLNKTQYKRLVKKNISNEVIKYMLPKTQQKLVITCVGEKFCENETASISETVHKVIETIIRRNDKHVVQ